ncbi:hypothetical protein UlMin_029375 [Ulmus minor]
MENIVSDLNVSEMKQNVLAKTFEALNSEASGVLLLTIQWKDLENHFNLMRKSFQEKLEELLEQEKRVGAKEKQLEAKEMEMSSKVGVKAKELADIEGLIAERSNEVELNLKKLDTIDRVNEELSKDLKNNQQEFDSLELLIRDKRRELDVTMKNQKCRKEKERNFDRISRAIRERKEKLEFLERSVTEKSEEAEFKERELQSLRGMLKKYQDDVRSTELQFKLVGISLEGRKRELELKEEQLRVCRSSVDESKKDIKQSEEKLDLIELSITTCSSELEVKEKKLHLVLEEIESKEKNLVSLKKLVDQCAHELDIKEVKSNGVIKELELKERSVELKIEEVDSFRKKVDEYLEEITLKEQSFGLLQRKVVDSSRELEIKESDFQKRVNEFELRQKEVESVCNSMESGANEDTNTIRSQVKIEQLECVPPTNTAIVPSPASLLHRLSKDGNCLQGLLNQHFKMQDSVGSEISRVLGASSDPAKLVLDAMKDFYPSHLSGGNAQFDLSIVRRSCILLLEQLMKASPQIDPRVREEAMTLAGAWKGKMMAATENYLEVLGFLQLLATYRLASAFDVDELHKLVDIVDQQRLESELRAALCIADKKYLNAELAENLPSENLLISAVNAEQAENSPSKIKGVEWFLNEVLTGNDLSEENILAALQKPDSTKHVLETIRRSFSLLWERGDVVFEASVIKRYILLFELLLKISFHIPMQLRKNARKLAVEWKAKLRANKENSLEVLAFLQFLVVYDLIWSFDEDKTLKFLEMISQHKEAPELFRILSDKLPGFVQRLIGRKKFIEAVRISCTFKLTNKFSPKQLLTEYLKDAKRHTNKFSKRKRPIDVKNKATDKEIAGLRTAILCIKDYDLESECRSAGILERISLLENIKRNRNRSLLETIKRDRNRLASSHSNFKQQQQQLLPETSKKRRHDSSSALEKQPQGIKTKFPKTVASTVSSCTMPNSTTIFQQISSSSDLHGSGLATNSEQFTFLGTSYPTNSEQFTTFFGSNHPTNSEQFTTFFGSNHPTNSEQFTTFFGSNHHTNSEQFTFLGRNHPTNFEQFTFPGSNHPTNSEQFTFPGNNYPVGSNYIR